MIIFWSVLLALWLVLLVSTFVRAKPWSVALRWMASGMVLMAVNMIVRDVATGHRWPSSQLRVVDSFGLGSSLINLGCMGVAIFIAVKAGQWGRRSPARGDI